MSLQTCVDQPSAQCKRSWYLFSLQQLTRPDRIVLECSSTFSLKFFSMPFTAAVAFQQLHAFLHEFMSWRCNSSGEEQKKWRSSGTLQFFSKGVTTWLTVILFIFFLKGRYCSILRRVGSVSMCTLNFTKFRDFWLNLAKIWSAFQNFFNLRDPNLSL